MSTEHFMIFKWLQRSAADFRNVVDGLELAIQDICTKHNNKSAFRSVEHNFFAN